MVCAWVFRGCVCYACKRVVLFQKEKTLTWWYVLMFCIGLVIGGFLGIVIFDYTHCGYFQSRRDE